MTAVTRRDALALGMGAAAMAALPAQARTPLAYDLRPKQVADGLWMLEGRTEYFSMENGGDIVNVAFAETDEGAVVFDTGSSLRYGEALRAAIQNTIGRGVAHVLNTHHHPDHFFGNQVFADVPTAALGQTKRLAEEQGDGFSDAMYHILGDWMRGTEVAPPRVALEGGSVKIGGRVFDLMPLGGHTAADLAVFDPRSGVLIAGDLAFLNRAPTTPHADLDLWRSSLETLTALGATAILPGHGPFDPASESLRQTRAYLDWLEARLRGALADGLDMAETMALPLPADIAALGAMPTEYVRSVAHLFPKFERAYLPMVE